MEFWTVGLFSMYGTWTINLLDGAWTTNVVLMTVFQEVASLDTYTATHITEACQKAINALRDDLAESMGLLDEEEVDGIVRSTAAYFPKFQGDASVDTYSAKHIIEAFQKAVASLRDDLAESMGLDAEDVDWIVRILAANFRPCGRLFISDTVPRPPLDHPAGCFC